MKIIQVIIRVFLMLTGFLFFYSLPKAVSIQKDHIKINFNHFFDSLKLSFEHFQKQSDPLYRSLLGGFNFVESYQYTLTILVSSILFVSLFGIVIAIIVMLVPHKATRKLKTFVNFFEAVPDLLLIFLFQFGVITLYKVTGLKFLQLFGVFGEKPYFIPIVTISFLPTFLLAQFLIKVLEEEKDKMYVLFVKAKGFGNLRIFVIHIIRNIFSLYIFQLRTIIWVLLSNIVLVEYLFNIEGFTKIFYFLLFRFDHFPTFAVCLIVFILPLIIIEILGLIISRSIKGIEETSI